MFKSSQVKSSQVKSSLRLFVFWIALCSINLHLDSHYARLQWNIITHIDWNVIVSLKLDFHRIYFFVLILFCIMYIFMFIVSCHSLMYSASESVVMSTDNFARQ